MPSAKQIAWRKKFARMSKAGKFRKKVKGDRTLSGKKRRIDDIDSSFPSESQLKSTTGYIVSSPRYPNGRIFKTLPEAMKEYRRQQKYGGAGVSGKTTVKSKNPKFHKVGNYWTP